MSDSFTTHVPTRELALSPQDLGELVQRFETPLGQYFGAAVTEGLWQMLAGQLRARGRMSEAERLATPEDRAPLSEEEWRTSEWHRAGVPYRPGLTIAGARTQAEIHDEREARRTLIAAGQTTLFRQALGIAAGSVGAALSPENWIPFAGTALGVARAGMWGARAAAMAERAAMLQAGGLAARAGFGAATTTFDATLGNLLALPVTVPGRESFGDDVTFLGVVQDLALGAVGAGAFGATFGAVFGRQAPGRMARAEPTDGAGGAGAPAATPLPIPTQDAALRGLTAGASQMAAGEHIDLALLPPEVRAELQRVRLELDRLRAMQQPEAGPGAGVAERAAARPLMATGAAAPGAEARATTPAGTEVGLRYEVVEAGDLVTSHRLPDFGPNPAFRQDLQPRDRSGGERQQQVRTMAARLRPEEIEASPLTTTGAPIVGPDGLVESGNGRTLAVTLAYREGLPTAQSYRAFLVRLGFDAAATMREPVLVRRRTSELDAAGRRRFVDESNSDVTDALTPAELARVDAQRLSADVLALLRGRDPAAAGNGDFVRAFLAALPGREGRALSVDGRLTVDGIARLRRALAARAFEDPALIARLAESPDAATEALARGLLDAAPTLARLRAAIEAGEVRPELDAVPALVRAVARLRQAADANLPAESVLRQGDLVDPPGAVETAMLELLLRHPNRAQLGGVGRDTIAERLEYYARHAAEAPTTPDMFGAPPPGLGEVLRATFREAGLEPPPALRGVEADSYSPPPRAPDSVPGDPLPTAAATTPEPPIAATAARDPAEAAAERQGFDLAGAAELRAEAARLAEAGAVPEELATALREAEAMADKMERAGEAWQAAATCVLRA